MYFFTFFKNSSMVVGSVFDMETWNNIPFRTPSFANIKVMLRFRFCGSLASQLNHTMHSLRGSYNPCLIFFRFAFVLGLALLVAKVEWNFSRKSRYELMEPLRSDCNHFSAASLSDNRNALHIFKLFAPRYDRANSNPNKWSSGLVNPL